MTHEGKVPIIWNQQLPTDRTIPDNKPDIIISDHKQGTCVSIDDAIPGDRNVIKKEAEKILKYKGLTVEIQGTWNVKKKCDTGDNRGDWDHFKNHLGST